MITPPTRRVETPQLVVCAVREIAALGLEADVLRLGEIRAQVMRGAGLQRLAILHHRLDRNRCSSAPGKRSFSGFSPAITGIASDVLGERAIHLQHPAGLLARLLGARGMGGMAFLPEKLGGAQEQPRRASPSAPRWPTG